MFLFRCHHLIFFLIIYHLHITKGECTSNGSSGDDEGCSCDDDSSSNMDVDLLRKLSAAGHTMWPKYPMPMSIPHFRPTVTSSSNSVDKKTAESTINQQTAFPMIARQDPNFPGMDFFGAGYPGFSAPAWPGGARDQQWPPLSPSMMPIGSTMPGYPGPWYGYYPGFGPIHHHQHTPNKNQQEKQTENDSNEANSETTEADKTTDKKPVASSQKTPTKSRWQFKFPKLRSFFGNARRSTTTTTTTTTTSAPNEMEENV